MPRLHDILTIFLIFVRDREVVVGEQDAAREAGCLAIFEAASFNLAVLAGLPCRA